MKKKKKLQIQHLLLATKKNGKWFLAAVATWLTGYFTVGPQTPNPGWPQNK